MGYKSKYKGSEIDSLLDKSKNDYNVKQYADYAGYNADTSRPSNTISFIQQDQSVVVGDKRYSQNAECYVGSNTSGISTTGNWFLCGEATLSAGHDVNIFGSVQQTLSSGALGLFALGLRGDSSNATLKTFQWLSKVGGSIPQLRIVINGFSVKLYCKVFGGQYNFGCVRLYQQGGRFGAVAYAKSYFKLANTDVIIPETDVPSGTDIADVPYITTTAANNKFLPILATTSLVQYNPNVGYIKFAEIDTKGQFGNKAIILAVSTTFASASNWNDGLYMINIRGNGASAATCRACCLVQYNLPADNTIKLYYAISGSKVEFYREVRAAKEFSQLGFKILSVENFENGSLWDFKLIESSKTTSDATLDTPIGTLTQITRVGHVSYADNTNYATNATNSQKVLQTYHTGNYERKVLLGENNNTTQQDKVYKSPDLTYNPSTKTLTVPTIKNPNSSWVHAAEGVAGQSGYVKIATIKINTVYTDQPLTIQFTGRSYLQPAKIYIRFYSENNTDPTLASFYYESGSTRFGEYLHKSATGTWDLYIKKGQSWDEIVVLSCENPYAFLSPNPNYSITWQDELVTTLPTGYVESVMSTKKIHISGNANSANKLVTARKIGFASFDGTADLSLNNIQGVFNVRWTTNTTQWQRVIRLKTKTTYTRKQLILAVYDIEGSSFSGIVEVTLTTGFQLTTTYAFVNWLSLWSAPNYNYKGIFKITATYPTDNNEYVYLDVYANSPYTYKSICFCVLSCNSTAELTIGNSNEWVEGSALQNVVYQSTTDTSLVPKQSLSATDSAFLQSLEGLCHKSNDSSLDLQRRTEYICGQQVLSDTEEAGKAFYGSSANPLVISVPFKDPGDAVAGGKVNVNLIRYYYSENYWHELFFGVNSPSIYTRWVGGGNARPWYRMMKEDSTIEYNAWVTKATNATNADVANKTKYPIVFKRNGASITNWFAKTTFTIDIPEELLDYSSPTGITLKVPEISVANKVANKLSLTVNGSTTEYDGSAGARVSIKANCTHIVKANSSDSLGTLYPEQTGHPSAVTVPISILPLEPYNSAARGLNDGDTLILHAPNAMSKPTDNYVWCVKLDITKENATDNIIPLIHGQRAGRPAFWNTSTTIPAGFYQFVYSATLGGLVYMYGNTSTT